MSTFAAHWRAHFGTLPPLSYALREQLPDRWLRFHALPGSRRYATTDEDRSEVLRRANTLATAVLGEGGKCWLVQAGSPEMGWSDDATLARAQFGLVHAWDFAEDESVWPVFAGPVTFRTGVFDELLTDIAEDRAFRTLWIRTDAPLTFAPYDGGFDLFLNSPTAVTALKHAHHAWLPDTASGL